MILTMCDHKVDTAPETSISRAKRSKVTRPHKGANNRWAKKYEEEEEFLHLLREWYVRRYRLALANPHVKRKNKISKIKNLIGIELAKLWM